MKPSAPIPTPKLSLPLLPVLHVPAISDSEMLEDSMRDQNFETTNPNSEHKVQQCDEWLTWKRKPLLPLKIDESSKPSLWGSREADANVVQYDVAGQEFMKPVEDLRAIEETYGWAGTHQVLQPADEDPLCTCNTLGHGSLGIVQEIRCKGQSLSTLVRKQVWLPLDERSQQARLEIAQEEASTLRTLVHAHIVSFVGSYEDRRQKNRPFYCLLTSPVGENDLKGFLEVASKSFPLSDEWRGWVEQWFACLASTLAHMHDCGVRHQDIKPSNIIHKRDRIFFTDFSSASHFEVGQTTSTDDLCQSTRMYAAQEVVNKITDPGFPQRHGCGSDIFALGGVFCEMLTILTQRSVTSFHDFLLASSSPGPETHVEIPTAPLLYSEKLAALPRWFATAPFFQSCICPMMSPDRTLRPTASGVLKAVRQSATQTWPEERACLCADV